MKQDKEISFKAQMISKELKMIVNSMRGITRAVVGIQSWDPLRLNVSSPSSRAPSSTAPLM